MKPDSYLTNTHNNPEHIRMHLCGIYCDAARTGISHIRQYCKRIFKDEFDKCYRPLNFYWRNSRLEQDLALEISADHPIIDYTINVYLKSLVDNKEKGILDQSELVIVGGDAKFIHRTVKGQGHGLAILTPCEEELFNITAETLGAMAFNLNCTHMKSMIDIYLINNGLMESEFTGISESTLSRIIDKYNLTTTTKTNTIDVARTVQQTVVVLESYFKIFDNVVHQMNKIDKIKCPWTEWRLVPPTYIYNYDEIGLNANTRHAPAIVSIATLLQKNIVWQNSSTGDSKMLFHISVGVTTQAAGNYNVPSKAQEGAGSPFVFAS